MGDIMSRSLACGPDRNVINQERAPPLQCGGGGIPAVEEKMQRGVGAAVAALAICLETVAFSQGRNETATVISRSDIQAVATGLTTGDREIRILDMGTYNLGVAVLRRTAIRPGAPITAINHTRLTEVYYVVSGTATLVTGGDVEAIRPIAADNELVTTVVGPGNTATFKRPAQSRTLNAGDVVVIPAGVYHGFSEIPDHLDYVAVRPDVEKVLPAGYVNPALTK
jgi:quercetin dioxygenase-like cupin family protein